jgi:hypothetical protein
MPIRSASPSLNGSANVLAMQYLDHHPVIGYLMPTCPTSADPSILDEILALANQGMKIHLFVLQPCPDRADTIAIGPVKAPMTYIPHLSHRPEDVGVDGQAVMTAYWYWLIYSPSIYWRTLQLSHRYRLEWEDFLQAMCLAQQLHCREIKQLKVASSHFSAAMVKIAQQFYDFSWTMTS